MKEGVPPAPTIEAKSLGVTAPPSQGAALPYLLVFYGDTTGRISLPLGDTIVGRDQDCGVRLGDQSVSRHHLQLRVSPNGVELIELQSRNGTFLNAQPLRGSALAGSGDVITLGDTVLVLRGAPVPVTGRDTLALADLKRRIDEETARAVAYGRPFALVWIEVSRSGVGVDAALSAIAPRLRKIDIVGSGQGEIVVLSPERGPEEPPTEIAGALDAIAPIGVGVAYCPADACEVDTLWTAARQAAADASPGELALAASTAQHLSIRDREVVVADPVMLRIMDLLRRLARSELPVLVCGETGTGKEVASAAIHHFSGRAEQPFVVLNCAAIPEALAESELFGHERGAFSGATASKRGYFEAAHHGTIFLDEIGDLPSGAQAKLLRVLDVKRFARVGDTREREVDVRVVAATNRDLEEEVRAGRFRSDLYYRLSGAKVLLPPLRERRRELPLLAEQLLRQACARLGVVPKRFRPAALGRIAEHAWPGNIRELKNVADYVASATPSEWVEIEDLPASLVPSSSAAGARPAATATDPARRFRNLAEEVEDLERRRMIEALQAADGVQKRAAELIGMPLRTFVTKLKQYRLRSSD
jgi:DNA-binding NtrC family response regulator